MSPPLLRQLPRFIADSSREGAPDGRLAELLLDAFRGACKPHHDQAGGPPGEVMWYPERSWGGRVWVPASARAESGEGAAPAEFFGHVSFVRTGEAELSDLRATADFTDVLPEQNTDWKIDLNEDVIGEWRGEGKRHGDVTLVWGSPLEGGALALTAELDGEVVDQTPIVDYRFTLIATDALDDRGETLYLTIRMWAKNGVELAAESLYVDDS